MSAPVKPARGPGALYAALMIGTVLVLAISVLTVPPSGVPAIAEIAPQAVKQIVAPPPEQQGDVGRTGGASQSGGAADNKRQPKQDKKSNVEVARIRKCVGDPPRQIEDPQSPPCVPYWPPDADNGGATSRGVTARDIRIAVPGGGEAQNRALELFFNKRFEFYGRNLVLVDTSADRKTEEPVQSQIAAARNAHAKEVFASTDYWYNGGVVYNEELARLKIIGVSYQSIFSEDELEAFRPYIWQYPMATDTQLAMLGEWMCARIAPGTTATHAGTGSQGLQRVFGLFVFEDYNATADTRPLEDGFRRCGGRFVTRRVLRATDDDRTAFQNAILQFKNDGVTSVVAVSDSEILGNLMTYASAGAYQPEWITPTFTENEHVWMKRTYPSEQAQHQFGLHVEPMHRLVGDDPWIWAITSSDTSFGWDRGGNESSYSRQAFYHPLYRSLLLIASGIQMAGPRLTPESFERGLQAARFPNPDHPIAAGAVGFEGNTHSMTKDVAEWWWSSNVVGPYGPAGFKGQGAGTMCFAGRATRYRIGEIRSGPDPLFAGACESGDRPAGGAR